jgi:hypothetical protein
MTIAVAGLCLLGLLGTVSVAAATTTARPVAAFSCGSFDHWMSAPGGTHFSATATLGPTTATLEGTISDVPFTRQIASPTLAIRDADTTVRSGPIDALPSLESPTETATPAPAITPDSIVAQSPDQSPEVVVPVCVARFAGSGHPVLLLGLYSGGAHCCTDLRAYPLTGSESLDGVDIWIGNPGVDVEANPHGNGVIVVTGDDAFNYQFASFAASGVPLKVLTFGNVMESAFQHP